MSWTLPGEWTRGGSIPGPSAAGKGGRPSARERRRLGPRLHALRPTLAPRPGWTVPALRLGRRPGDRVRPDAGAPDAHAPRPRFTGPRHVALPRAAARAGRRAASGRPRGLDPHHARAAPRGLDRPAA